MTRDELRAKLEDRDPELLNSIWAMCKTLPNTRPFWERAGRQVNCMGEQWGGFTWWTSQSLADTHLAWMKERVPGPLREALLRKKGSWAQVWATLPAHAVMLYLMHRNMFLDVYVSGFLGCDQYTAKDELQGREVFHTHVLGHSPCAPTAFRDQIRAIEQRRAVGGRDTDNGESEDGDEIEELNGLPEVQEAAAYFARRCGALSQDPTTCCLRGGTVGTHVGLRT